MKESLVNFKMNKNRMDSLKAEENSSFILSLFGTKIEK